MAKEGLFDRLLDLHSKFPNCVPEEDFFTELAAYLFEKSPTTLLAWLVGLGWDNSIGYSKIEVESQAEYEALPDHDRGSRPDIRIQLYAEGVQDLIFIESKLGAQEGHNQLQYYGEILHNDPDANRKWLIYITREDIPKDTGYIFKNIPCSKVVYKQLYWRDFYRFLKHQPPEFLIEEVMQFMKENEMDEKQIEFTESDLIAMSNIRRPFQLMYSVLDKSMQRRFQSIVNSKFSFTPAEYLTEDWARFGLEGEIVDGAMHCVLGFCEFTGETQSDPKLYFLLQPSGDGSTKEGKRLRNEIIDMLSEVKANRQDWTGWGLEKSDEDSGIDKTYSLRKLIQSENLINECQKVLIGYLDELVEIKRQYNQIPWKIQN